MNTTLERTMATSGVRVKPTFIYLSQTDSIRAELERNQAIVGDVIEYHPRYNPQELEDELEGSIYTIEYISNPEERQKVLNDMVWDGDVNAVDTTALIRVVDVDDRYNKLLNRIKEAQQYIGHKFDHAKKWDDYQTMANMSHASEIIKNIIL